MPFSRIVGTGVNTRERTLENVLIADGYPLHTLAIHIFLQIDIGIEHQELSFETVVLLVDKPRHLGQLFRAADDDGCLYCAFAVDDQRLVAVVVPHGAIESHFGLYDCRG